ncbi:uncharacterized protein RJT21DRAFT_52655 [Scheffersomyces amazonensis]|uniref:uncharacterized protein n=1 Tax=Scheffersomyces amazonensis TaxID=1078765 RepID=UPI00315D6A77
MFRLRPMQRIMTSMSPVRLMTMRRFPSSIIKRFQSGTSIPSSSSSTKPKGKGIKALVQEYGLSALGVYLALSAIDLPICYVIVHSSGKEVIEEYENTVKNVFGYGISKEELKKNQELRKLEEAKAKEGEIDIDTKKNTNIVSYLISHFSWTEFAIAYGIHKSLIFIRLPITAAITPGIVKILRGWGFKIGNKAITTTKAGTSAATPLVKNANDVSAYSNPQFGTRPNRKKKWFAWFF